MFHVSEINDKEVNKVSDQLQSVGVSSVGGDAAASTAPPSGKPVRLLLLHAFPYFPVFLFLKLIKFEIRLHSMYD